MIYMLATTEDTLSLDKLNYVTSGTAPLAIATRQRFESRYHVPVMQAYGMTEIGSVAQERYDDVMAGRRGPGSVGRISPGVEIIFRDIETGKEVADGQEGEICVRTSEMPDEFVGGAKVPVDEDGWFATSDVGYLDDNEILYITGRTQEKLIVGGFNVFPAEVEDIARSTEVVLDTVVIGIADERLGEIPVIGVLWVDEPEERRLYHEMRERLAHYKVPRAIFTLEAIPLTPREKVDRIRCREMAEQAVADGDAWTPER
jgi:acyl-CoA synthetase (AMP-forming)/AMP-acid ligase II